MASLSTYLAWQGTGELECGEDAGRAGVGAAALVGFEIFALLESRAADASDEELALTRQILPWLPSFASEFVDRADELERDASAVADSGSCPSHVRADVAAMRDALVRNAGPVALFAAESALEEAAGSSYADALLEPLTERLRRYFNCAPALDRLRSMRALGAFPSRDAADAVDELERATADLEAIVATRGESEWSSGSRGAHSAAGAFELTGAEGAAVLRALTACTAVRAYLIGAIASEPLDASRATRAEASKRQSFRGAESALEELARAALARALFCAGVVDGGVGDDGAGEAAFEGALVYDREAWPAAASTTAEALRHLALSGFRAAECHACAREIEAWCGAPGGPSASREDALRAAASLERAESLAERHAALIERAYGDAPARLAGALGVPPSASDAFVENALRNASTSRLLARFAAPMRRAARRAAGVSENAAKKSVVPGAGVGKLVEIDALAPGALDAVDNGYNGSSGDGSTDALPVVAFVWRADGDADATSAGARVRGVVAAQPIRPDSRLAVRARQEGIPLVASPSLRGAENAARAARALANEWVSLVASDSGDVLLSRASDAEIAEAKRRHASSSRDGHSSRRRAPVPTRPIVPREVRAVTCRPLSEATPPRAGYKAAACGDLLRVASRPGSGFRAPDGVFLPFGCAESALREQGLEPDMRRAAAALDDAIERGLGDAEVERRRVEAQRVAAEARLPDAVAATVCAAFWDGPDAENTRLVVRASADVEDPAGAGGAEIYASVAGVPANNARALAEAVSEVWRSLFSRGAVVLRRAVGAENAGARMAVVVQALLPADLSFHLHTGGALENGLVRRVEENQTGTGAGLAPLPSPVMEAEIVVGSGEALRSRLADGRGGEPWRVEVDQRTGEVRTTRFASVGAARFLDADAPGGWREEAVDYSRRALSSDADARRRLAARLAAAGAALEAEAGAAQNAEGCVVGEEVWVVQTRPQP